MNNKLVIGLVFGLIALAIIGLFLIVLLPNKDLPAPAEHRLGTFTQGGLARNIIGNL